MIECGKKITKTESSAGAVNACAVFNSNLDRRGKIHLLEQQKKELSE